VPAYGIYSESFRRNSLVPSAPKRQIIVINRHEIKCSCCAFRLYIVNILLVDFSYTEEIKVTCGLLYHTTTQKYWIPTGFYRRLHKKSLTTNCQTFYFGNAVIVTHQGLFVTFYCTYVECRAKDSKFRTRQLQPSLNVAKLDSCSSISV